MAYMMNNCALISQEQSCMSCTTVPAATYIFDHMRKNGADSAKTFVKNLAMLMDRKKITPSQLSKISGISTRHIHYILNGERVPSVGIVDDIAAAFGLMGYHLQIPDLNPDLIANGSFDKLYHAYIETDESGRRVMESTAEYVTSHKQPSANGKDGHKNMGNASGSS